MKILRILMITTILVVMLAMSLLPGIPMIPFVALGGGAGALAYIANKRQQAAPASDAKTDTAAGANLSHGRGSQGFTSTPRRYPIGEGEQH